MWCSTSFFCFHNNKGLRERVFPLKNSKEKTDFENLHVHVCTTVCRVWGKTCSQWEQGGAVYTNETVVLCLPVGQGVTVETVEQGGYCVHQWGKVVLWYTSGTWWYCVTPVGHGGTVYTNGA